MAEEYGTENLKKLSAVVIELSNVADKMLTDDAPMMERAKHAFSLVDEMLSLQNISFSDMKKEFQDLSATERAEMVEFFNNKFDIKSDRTEQAVERTLALASYLFSAYPMVKELVTLIKNKEDEAPAEPAPEEALAPKRKKKK